MSNPKQDLIEESLRVLGGLRKEETEVETKGTATYSGSALIIDTEDGKGNVFVTLGEKDMEKLAKGDETEVKLSNVTISIDKE